jgi:two-component system, LuxR family, response regulator FixJ
MTPKPTVFIIDDDRAVRRTLTLWVETAGLRAATYDSVDEFLSAYAHGQPGCLVFDVRTPGLSGEEFQARLSDASVDMPVILVATREDVPGVESAVKAGDAEVIVKPCTEALLLDRIRQALVRDAMRRRYQVCTPQPAAEAQSGRRRTDTRST